MLPLPPEINKKRIIILTKIEVKSYLPGAPMDGLENLWINDGQGFLKYQSPY
jgi:hypothetical protein